MTTVSDPILDRSVTGPSGQGGLTLFIDRWMYVFTAFLILAVVLLGFVPSSGRMLARIEAGAAPPIPLILHVHAVLMGSWIMLLLTQTVLMATGRRAMHMQLGMTSLLLAPAIIIAGFILVPVRHAQLYEAIAAAPADVAAYLQTQMVPFATNIMLAQIRSGVVFAILVAVALYLRKADSETHKRLFILATLVPMGAATDRILFLPSTMPGSPLSTDIYPFLIAAPMLLWDLYRRGRIQRAYVIWFALMAPTGIAVNLLWNTPWWLATGPKLVGAG